MHIQNCTHVCGSSHIQTSTHVIKWTLITLPLPKAKPEGNYYLNLGGIISTVNPKD